MGEKIRFHRDLLVYQKAFSTAMDLFELSKGFPKEETYSLTDQIRRSSRSVCANLAEGWRKRRYEGAFISKLSDSESEAAETQIWANFWLVRFSASVSSPRGGFFFRLAGLLHCRLIALESGILVQGGPRRI